MIDVSDKKISNWELNIYAPSLLYFAKLKIALNAAYDELMEDTIYDKNN